MQFIQGFTVNTCNETDASEKMYLYIDILNNNSSVLLYSYFSNIATEC